MIKQFIFIIGILATSLLRLGSDRVSISQVVPATIHAGDEFQMEVLISKMGISGYGKAQTNLPPGFVALDDGSKGALVRQDDNVLKIIWMELPETDEFTVRLRVLVDPGMTPGDHAFNFRFSYLDGNEKRSVNGSPVTIKVLPPTPETLARLKAEQERSQPQVLNKDAGDNLNQIIAESGLGCTMVTERKSETEQQVNIKIQKGSIAGFGKVEVPVCEGLIATNVSNEKGVFSFTDNKVKYVWTDMPQDPVMNLSFKLIRSPGSAWLNACSIDGEFSYLDQDQSKKCKINVVNLNYVSDEMYAKMNAAQVSADNVNKTAATTTQDANTGGSSATTAVNNPSVANTVTPDTKVSPAESTGTAVPENARVQAQNDQSGIAAGTGNQTAKQSVESVYNKNAGQGADVAAVLPNTSVTGSEKEVAKSGNSSENVSDKKDENKDLVATQQSNKNNNSENKLAADAPKADVNLTVKADEGSFGEGKNKKSADKNRTGHTSVIFKVQVCATHRDRTAVAIQAFYKLQDEVVQEMHEGWFKFTVGQFSEYAEARNKRDELAPFNLPGPFVTAYNHGTRITVQEALMITAQTWVK